MDDTPLPITRIYSRPVVGVLFCIGTYLCTMFVAGGAARILPAGGPREFVVLSLPLTAMFLVVGIIYFVYRGSDEYVRHRILNCAALTLVILAFSTAVYFSLERLGFPQLSMFVVNLYGWSVFTILFLWVLCRAR